MINPIELVLTCGSWQEAQHIADHLLEAQLVVSAELLKSDGIKLIVTTAEKFYSDVEAEIQKLHRSETLDIQRLPMPHHAKTA